MPNWVHTSLVIESKKDEDLQEFKTKQITIENNENHLDFDLIIPQPFHFNEDTNQAIHNETNEVFDWYHWRCDNWGTKWDCNDFAIEDEEKNWLVVSFSTAWSFPFGIAYKLSKLYPNLEFSYMYYDEDVGSNYGYIDFENGNTNTFHVDYIGDCKTEDYFNKCETALMDIYGVDYGWGDYKYKWCNKDKKVKRYELKKD